MLQTTIRQLKLPVSQRDKLNSKSMENLEQFEILLKEMKAKLDMKVGSLKDDLLPYLQTDSVCESFYNWNVLSLPVDQRTAVDAGNVQRFLYMRLFQIVDSRFKKDDLQQWAKIALARGVAKAEQMLIQANLHISGSVQSTFGIKDNHNDLSRSSTISQFLAICAGVGISIGASWVTGEFLETVALSSAVLAVTAPWPIVGIFCSVMAVAVAKRVWQSTAIEKFKRNIRQAYDEFISNTSQLQEVILTLLQYHCKPVQAVSDTLPQMYGQLQKTLAVIERAKEEHRPKYDELLSKCQDLNAKLSIMTFQCMPHKFTSNDILWPQPKTAVASGSFAEVYKLTIPGADEVALKVIKRDITQGNTASDVKKEFDVCRYQLLSFIVTTMLGLLYTFQIYFVENAIMRTLSSFWGQYNSRHIP